PTSHHSLLRWPPCSRHRVWLPAARSRYHGQAASRARTSSCGLRSILASVALSPATARALAPWERRSAAAAAWRGEGAEAPSWIRCQDRSRRGVHSTTSGPARYRVAVAVIATILLFVLVTLPFTVAS